MSEGKNTNHKPKTKGEKLQAPPPPPPFKKMSEELTAEEFYRRNFMSPYNGELSFDDIGNIVKMESYTKAKTKELERELTNRTNEVKIKVESIYRLLDEKTELQKEVERLKGELTESEKNCRGWRDGQLNGERYAKKLKAENERLKEGITDSRNAILELVGGSLAFKPLLIRLQKLLKD